MDGKELASTLVKMAVSPVKADREAIARLERECGMEVTVIAVSLENSELMHQHLLTSELKKELNISKVFAMGAFWGAVMGIAMLFARPPYAVSATFLGAVAGISGAVVQTKS